MDTLKALVAEHHFIRNGMRTNADADPNNRVTDASKRQWLRRGPYSNTLRDPNNPIVAHV